MWHTRENSGLKIDREGRWFHDGEPIEHPGIVALFQRGLERAPDGRYILRVGRDWAVVEVEDVPFQVVGLRIEGEAVILALSGGTEEPLDPATLRLAADGVLRCEVRGGIMPARFSRAAQGILGQRILRVGSCYMLEVGGVRHALAVHPPSGAVVS